MSSLVDHVARALRNAYEFDTLDVAESRRLAIAAIEAYRQPGKPPEDMAPHEEVECALALFRALKQANGEFRAVKVEAPAFWNIVIPRTQEALLAALETEQPSMIQDNAENEALSRARLFIARKLSHATEWLAKCQHESAAYATMHENLAPLRNRWEEDAAKAAEDLADWQAVDFVLRERDGWFEAHENLLGVRQSDLAALVARQPSPLSGDENGLIRKFQTSLYALRDSQDDTSRGREVIYVDFSALCEVLQLGHEVAALASLQDRRPDIRSESARIAAAKEQGRREAIEEVVGWLRFGPFTDDRVGKLRDMYGNTLADAIEAGDHAPTKSQETK